MDSPGTFTWPNQKEIPTQKILILTLKNNFSKKKKNDTCLKKVIFYP